MSNVSPMTPTAPTETPWLDRELRDIVDCITGLWGPDPEAYTRGWTELSQSQAGRVLGGLAASSQILIAHLNSKNQIPDFQDGTAGMAFMERLAAQVPMEVGLPPDELMNTIEMTIDITEVSTWNRIALDPAQALANFLGVVACLAAWVANDVGADPRQYLVYHLGLVKAPSIEAILSAQAAHQSGMSQF